MPENLEDIYDARIYKKLSEEGEILSNPDNIPFMWNTDGVKIFKSSKLSIWPMILIINELPYNEIHEKENLILAGLWFGEQKPITNVHLTPLYSDVEKLLHGVPVSVPNVEN